MLESLFKKVKGLRTPCFTENLAVTASVKQDSASSKWHFYKAKALTGINNTMFITPTNTI